MLERSLRSAGVSFLALSCWLSASPAEGRTSGPSDSVRVMAAPVPDPSASAAASTSTPISDSSERAAASTNASVASAPLRAPRRQPFPGAPLLVTVPLSDLPYGFEGGFSSPSMRQSLQWRVGTTQLANQTIGWLWEAGEPGLLNSIGSTASLTLFNMLWVYLPPGPAWTHEEWHRAVLTHRGVSSYNGVYHWDIGTSAIAVDHVADRDLAELKAEHPADFTRLMEAGLESETEATRLMRRNNFFLGRRSGYDLIDWWSTGVNGSLYLAFCATDALDGDLRDMNAKETRESQRDFTGFDFRAWAHDMRHPDEAYADGPRAGGHPSGGEGVDRYLLYSDLTAGERLYLKLQAGLSLLNFVSPQFFGRDWLPGRAPWTGEAFLWNFGLLHHLTPFGYEVGGDFLLRRGKWSWAFTAQGFVNGEMVLPGASAELFRYPAMLGSFEIFLNGGLSVWMQPADQKYLSADALPGMAGSIGAAIPLISSLELFGEADAKTQGWVAGNVNLDPALQARAGLQLKL